MDDPIPEPRLIYFAERHPTLSPEAFTARWRRHGQLGMSLPRWRNVRSYLQCDPLGLAVPGIAARPCDGVAVVIYRSEQHRQAHLADRSAAAVMKADEAATFARPVAQFAVLTETLALQRPRPGRCKLFVELRRAPGLAVPAFRAAWLAAAGPLAADLAGRGLASGYLHNRAIPPAPGADTLCDAVDEIDCDAAGAAASALANHLAGLTHLAAARVVATQPELLHQAFD